MDLVNDWLTSAIDQVCIVIRSRSINHWPGSHSHEYTEIKSITALSNNKEFFKLFNSIFNKIGYNCFIIFQDYLNIKILKCHEFFEILWKFRFKKKINFEIWNSIFSTLPQSEYTLRAVSTPCVRYIQPCVYFCLLSIRCFNVVQPETRFHFQSANQIAKIVKNFKISKFNFFFKNQKILYMYL